MKPDEKRYILAPWLKPRTPKSETGNSDPDLETTEALNFSPEPFPAPLSSHGESQAMAEELRGKHSPVVLFPDLLQ
jgi:hypothetical protein